jgi:hypothetical protein
LSSCGSAPGSYGPSTKAGPADKKLYQRQIEATDAEVHALVYELYGLTEEEIAIVEEQASKRQNAATNAAPLCESSRPSLLHSTYRDTGSR